MTVITRSDLENKAKCEALVEKKLDAMGVGDPDMEYATETRASAKEYYIEQLQEHLRGSTEVVFGEYFDGLELDVWDYVRGYQAGYKAGLES